MSAYEDDKSRRINDLYSQLQPFGPEITLDQAADLNHSMQIKLCQRTLDEHTVMKTYIDRQLKAIQNVKLRAKEAQDMKVYKKEQAIQRAKSVQYAKETARQQKLARAALNQEPVSAFQYKESSDSDEGANRKKVLVVKEKKQPLDPHIQRQFFREDQ